MYSGYHLGTGPECDDRVSLLIPASPIPKPSGKYTFADRAYFNPAVTPFDSRTIAWRRAEVGAANGHGNARSAAAVLSILACGGEARGVRLLSEAGCERVFEEDANRVDLVLDVPLRWGMGYAIGSPLLEARVGSRVVGRRVAG